MRHSIPAVCVIFYCGFAARGADAENRPIALHPDNPHYFLFRAKPTMLVGSTEHYGAVLNREFDNVKYLDTLRRDGLNLTRTFSGTYREVPGSFHIHGNTLAPKAGQYLAPWRRSDRSEKFDLHAWDDGYFKRLRDFVRAAGVRNIVVEYVLFCPFYEQVLWDIDPMNAKNNVNRVGDLPREKVYTLDNGGLLAIQDAFVRKAVAELKDADNVYFEICNEPYFGGVTLDWQRHIAQTIAEAEKVLPTRHLIAQNIANGSAKVDHPDPLVSIFNFHYANPPEAVRANLGLNKVISYDETGFKGSDDAVYRVHGWEFMLAGGGVYDNLDYSFVAGHEDGTAPVDAPGGGSPALRKQLAILKHFVESFDFVRMSPATAPRVGDGITATMLAEPGKQYAIYLRRAQAEGKQKPEKTRNARPVKFTMDLPEGEFDVTWLDPVTGTAHGDPPVHVKGTITLMSPDFGQDIALRLAVKRS